VAEWETDSQSIRRTSTDRLFAAVSGNFPRHLYGFVWMGDVSFRARETIAIYSVARPMPEEQPVTSTDLSRMSRVKPLLSKRVYYYPGSFAGMRAAPLV